MRLASLAVAVGLTAVAGCHSPEPVTAVRDCGSFDTTANDAPLSTVATREAVACLKSSVRTSDAARLSYSYSASGGRFSFVYEARDGGVLVTADRDTPTTPPSLRHTIQTCSSEI